MALWGDLRPYHRRVGTSHPGGMVSINSSLKVIVGVDGSESSLDALHRAAQIASATSAPLEAITTWQYPMAFDSYFPMMDDWSPGKNAESVLAAATERAFHGSPPQRFTSRVIEGPAAQVLIEQSLEASMLVLGTRGHGGFAGLLLGSVSSACAERAQCPVLIMHRPRHAETGTAPPTRQPATVEATA